MKIFKYSILTLAAVGIAIGAGGSAYAFHAGGVADCVGCHSMHNPYPVTDNDLLLGGDTSAVCLNCHERSNDTGPRSYHISTPGDELVDGVSPKQRTPGGDFGWLKKTYTWPGRGGSTATEEGHTHGHNIIAGSGFNRDGEKNYGYTVDPVNATAPGGTFDANNLRCVSCHDPHGQARRLADNTIMRPAGTAGSTYLPIANSGSYNNSNPPVALDTAVGVYRLLGGPGYAATGVTYTGAPAAVAPSTYNQSEATNQVKVAYGRSELSGNVTWSTWCGSCHGDMHYSAGGNYVHPTDQGLVNGTYTNYNAYVKTGDLTGLPATSFTSLVPIVYNTNDYATLAGKADNALPEYPGPDASTDRVDCLSCHRAHASGWEYALRWNPEYEFLTQADGTYYDGSWGGRGRTAAEVEDSYYDRPSTVFAKSQRSLCNKCHVKD